MKTEMTVLLSLILFLRASAGVLPPDAVVGGRTIGEWSAEWYKWTFSCPTNDNPLRDTNGVNALNCQPDGPVFFLAGVQFGDLKTATRTFTIPEGKHLFFPILNVYAGDPADPPKVPERRDLAAAFITNYIELHASIDGVAVGNLGEHRAQSPVFSFEFPSCDNMMTVNNGFCISGLVDDLVADGYYLMVEPLPLGEHVVNFGGTLGPPFGFQIDITDTIIVVPDPNQYVMPTNAVVGGKTIEEWSVEWWKWAFSLPTNQNPLLDMDGSSANNGQPEGDVFFLGAVLWPSPIATRAFTVPEGKYLFFPPLNVWSDNVFTDPPLSVEQLRDLNAAYIDPVTNLYASVDGVGLTNLFAHRIISPVFNVFLSDPDNIESYVAGQPFTGLNDPIATDGFWIMLKPLSRGEHVINFGGTFGPPLNLHLDITATITVVPLRLEQKVEELLAKVEVANIPAKRKRALEITLLRAGASFENAKLRAGIHHLRAFQHKVRAQLSRSDRDLARDFISQAQAIIDRAKEDLPKKSRGHHDDDDDEGDDDR